MPKLPIDYSKCCIYKIEHLEDENNYILETLLNLKREYIRTNVVVIIHQIRLINNKLYQMIRENGGWNNFRMIEVEKYPCADKREAEKIECEVMIELKASMNTKISYLTDEDRKKNQKEYTLKHTDEKKERDKKYYEMNKDLKKQYREKNNEHIKAYRDLNKIKQQAYNKEYRVKNNEIIKQKEKEYRENNKEILKLRNKEYRVKNEERIKIQKKIYREQNKQRIQEHLKIYRENMKLS